MFKKVFFLKKIDSVIDSYAPPTTTTKSTFKPMPFVRAGESVSSLPTNTTARAMEESDDEEDVKHFVKKD